MKKNILTYGAALIIAVAMSAIIISIFISQVSKDSEKIFHSAVEKTNLKILENGYNEYIAQSNGNHKEQIEQMNGGALADDEKLNQLHCYVTHHSEKLNNDPEYLAVTSGVQMTTVYRYYDSDLGSIMNENMLMLVRRCSGASIYYTYQDESLTTQMNYIRKQYGDKIGTVVFHVRNAYINGNVFLPANFSYYTIGEDGQKSKEEDIYTPAEDEETLLELGYELFKVDDEFRIGDAYDDLGVESYVFYASELDEARRTRVDELVSESSRNKESMPESTFLTKKPGPMTYEFFCLNKLTSADESDTYYAMAYEKKTLPFMIVEYFISERYAVFYGFLSVVGILVSFAVAFVGATIYNGKRK